MDPFETKKPSSKPTRTRGRKCKQNNKTMQTRKTHTTSKINAAKSVVNNENGHGKEQKYKNMFKKTKTTKTIQNA